MTSGWWGPPTSAGFPAEGANLAYTVDRGPIHMKDRTTVRIAEPLHRLEMEANARPVGTARISRCWPGARSRVVVIDEHPLSGLGWLLHNPLSEMVLSLRRMAHNLAKLVESRAQGSDEG